MVGKHPIILLAVMAILTLAACFNLCGHDAGFGSFKDAEWLFRKTCALRPLPSDESEYGDNLRSRLGREGEWVARISEAIDFPDVKANREGPYFISFGRFDAGERYEPDYRDAVLDERFIRAYDTQPPEERYAVDMAGKGYDRGLKVRLPGDFTARFPVLKESDGGEDRVSRYFGIVIHDGSNEVARMSLSRTQPWHMDAENFGTDYKIVWLEVRDEYKKRGIAAALCRAALAIARKDPYARRISAIADDPATLVILWDLGFKWKINIMEGWRLKEDNAAYMRMIDAIIRKARLNAEPDIRRQMYRYLCNGQGNEDLGIVNRDGVRFAGEKDRQIVPYHEVADGEMYREITLADDEAIRERLIEMSPPDMRAGPAIGQMAVSATASAV
ncbi:MAG: hypothetical protein ABH825_04750 [Candidatus Omnitrophota bacterium]